LNAPPKNILWLIFFTNFLDMLGFGLVLPVLGFIFETDNALFSGVYEPQRLKFLYLLLVGSYSIGTLIGAPVLGALSDKYGRRKMLMFTYSFNIFFYLVFVLGIINVSYPLLYVGRVGAGLIGASLLIVQSAIADVSKPEEKTKNFGITGIAFGLGFIIGAYLGGILTDWYGYTIPFYVSCCVTFSNFLFIIFLFKETNQHRTNKPISPLTGLQNFIKAFTNKSLRNIFFVIFLMTTSFNFLIQFYQFYVRESFHFSKQDVGVLYAFIGLSVAFTQGVILRPLSQKYSPTQLLSVGLFFFSIAYLLLLIPTQTSLLYFTTFIVILFQGVTFPTTLSVVSNQASKDVQGETIGINQAVQSAAAAFPIVIGAVMNLGYMDLEYSFPMWFGAAVTFLSWVFFMYFFVLKKGK